MALELQILRESHGFNVPNAYWRITIIETDFESEVGLIVITAYKDEEAAKTKPPADRVDQRIYRFNPTSVPSFDNVFGRIKRGEILDVFSALYGFMKTQPEFEGAKDIYDGKQD